MASIPAGGAFIAGPKGPHQFYAYDTGTPTETVHLVTPTDNTVVPGDFNLALNDTSPPPGIDGTVTVDPVTGAVTMGSGHFGIQDTIGEPVIVSGEPS